VLPDQIHDVPATITLLHVREGQRRDLGTPESAAEKNGENCAVAKAA
jgi:hypothetical protein